MTADPAAASRNADREPDGGSVYPVCGTSCANEHGVRVHVGMQHGGTTDEPTVTVPPAKLEELDERLPAGYVTGANRSRGYD